MDKKLADNIKRILKNRQDLLKEQYREKNRKHPLEGHCYVASEVYFHIKGGYDQGYQVYRVNHRGDTHWFLKNESDEVIDLTAEQFDEPIPYEQATKTGFLTKEPSKRAKQVIKELKK